MKSKIYFFHVALDKMVKLSRKPSIKFTILTDSRDGTYSALRMCKSASDK